MSDRSICARLAVVVALLAAGAAQADTQDCTALPVGFVLCAEGTVWADAEMLEFDNGVAFEMDPYWLEVFPAPESVQSAAPFEAVLDAMADLIAEQARNEGLGTPETLTRDTFETDNASFATLTTRVDLPEDDPMIYMTMIADAGEARIILTLDSDIASSIDGVPQVLRELADLIRPQEN